MSGQSLIKSEIDGNVSIGTDNKGACAHGARSQGSRWAQLAQYLPRCGSSLVKRWNNGTKSYRCRRPARQQGRVFDNDYSNLDTGPKFIEPLWFEPCFGSFADDIYWPMHWEMTLGNEIDVRKNQSQYQVSFARDPVITKSSDESTITPTLSHDPLEARPASEHLDFTIPAPPLTYNAKPETPSAVSSPDFLRSSSKVPRMYTASSSITNRATLNSSPAGDYSLTLHSSFDDVPSLIDSASTSWPSQIYSSTNTFPPTDRSDLFSTQIPTLTRLVSPGKRDSLVSLTRLVSGGSYNRSKLNIEERIQPDTPEKTETKKGNRISPLMKFWESKEKLSPSGSSERSSSERSSLFSEKLCEDDLFPSKAYSSADSGVYKPLTYESVYLQEDTGLDGPLGTPGMPTQVGNIKVSISKSSDYN